MKFVLITSQVINRRNYERFALNQMEKHGSLTIIDITEMLYPKIFEIQIRNQMKDLDVIFVNQETKLKDAIAICESADLVISLLGRLDERTTKVYKYLSRYSDRLCLIISGGFPSEWYGSRKNLFSRLTSKIYREKSFLGVFKKIYFILFNKVMKNPVYSRYILSSSRKNIDEFKDFFNQDTEVFSNCNYDYILSQKEHNKIIEDRYMVFLDENLIKHTDFVINNASVEDEEIYYEELSFLLEHIEKKYDLKVVVAAHPRSDISYTKRKLPRHEVILGETAGLVRFSEGCINHASTSINFAVIYQKPICFVTSDRMLKSRPDNALLASWFDKKPINMSNIHDFDNFTKMLITYFI